MSLLILKSFLSINKLDFTGIPGIISKKLFEKKPIPSSVERNTSFANTSLINVNSNPFSICSDRYVIFAFESIIFFGTSIKKLFYANISLL